MALSRINHTGCNYSLIKRINQSYIIPTESMCEHTTKFQSVRLKTNKLKSISQL